MYVDVYATLYEVSHAAHTHIVRNQPPPPEDMEPQRVFTLHAALKCWVEWERVQWWMLVESPGGEEEQLSVESARAHYSSRGTSFEQHVHVLKPRTTLRRRCLIVRHH